MPPDRTVRHPARQVMTVEALTEAGRRAYPDYAIASADRFSAAGACPIDFTTPAGETIEREFSAYTGEDLGDPFPASGRGDAVAGRAARRPADGHERRGRFWNGIGSILATLLCITGAIIWWPGIASGGAAISVKRRASWTRLNFDLHSALGFWFFVIIFIWALSGIYLSMPVRFMDVVNCFWGRSRTSCRTCGSGDVALEWLVRLHFGRWRSHTLKAVWVVIGLLPAVMFVTGCVMWWNRVVRNAADGAGRQPQPVLARLRQNRRAE